MDRRVQAQESYPLHTAVHQKKPAVVKALLLLGARRDSKYRGNTPEEQPAESESSDGGEVQVEL
eukprot:Skav224841  [mRNA]  locus=scaffold3408:306556:312052:+ [translate_table: standard]